MFGLDAKYTGPENVYDTNVSDGYWVMLQPLSEGMHVLNAIVPETIVPNDGNPVGIGTFSGDLTWNITVDAAGGPVPPTVLLLGLESPGTGRLWTEKDSLKKYWVEEVMIHPARVSQAGFFKQKEVQGRLGCKTLLTVSASWAGLSGLLKISLIPNSLVSAGCLAGSLRRRSSTL